MAKEKKLSPKQYSIAIWHIAKTVYKAAPLAVTLQLLGAFISAILPIVVTYFAALTTTALADAYNGVQGAGQQAIIYVIVTVLLGVGLNVWSSLEQYIGQLMRFKIEASISDQMYEHFLSLDFWRYDDKDTADLYDRATSFSRFFPYVFDRISAVITQFITMLAGLIALGLVSGWLALVVLVAVIPGIYIQFKLSRAQVAHQNAHVTTRRSRYMLEWLLGNQQNAAELRLYNVVKHLLALRQSLRNKDEKERIEFERQYIFKRLAADMIEAAAELVALIFITVQVIARHQPIGQFIYVQQVVSRALGGAKAFVSQISTLDEDLANLFDYQEFMELPRQVGGGQKLRSLPALIQLDKVTFHYPGSERQVLKQASISIKKGQHIAIVGENGAGKSTLIKILTGLYQPVEGRVLLDGKNLNEFALASWHQLFAVLQQNAVNYDFANIQDNVRLGNVNRPFDEKRLNQAISSAQASQFIDKLPQKLHTYINPWMEDEEGNKGTNLSGGQWQRVALARNFYRDSPLIILDEPTSAIDALAEEQIFNHLFADPSKTVVTISHRLTTIEKADLIYVMQDGEVVEQGTHNQLVEARAAYYRIFKSQLRSKNQTTKKRPEGAKVSLVEPS